MNYKPLQNRRAPFPFSWHYKTLHVSFSVFRDFSKCFSPKGLLSVFSIFCNKLVFQTAQSVSPFAIFGIEIFQITFRPKIWFSQWTSKLYPIFCFLKESFFGTVRLFSNFFLSKPPSTFSRNETFCGHIELPGFDIAHFPKKKNSKFFSVSSWRECCYPESYPV